MRAAGFLGVAFLAMRFLATGFLAVVFFAGDLRAAGFLAVAFLAMRFLATDFLAVVFFAAPGFFLGSDLVAIFWLLLIVPTKGPGCPGSNKTGDCGSGITAAYIDSKEVIHVKNLEILFWFEIVFLLLPRVQFCPPLLGAWVSEPQLR